MAAMAPVSCPGFQVKLSAVVMSRDSKRRPCLCMFKKYLQNQEHWCTKTDILLCLMTEILSISISKPGLLILGYWDRIVEVCDLTQHHQLIGSGADRVAWRSTAPAVYVGIAPHGCVACADDHGSHLYIDKSKYNSAFKLIPHSTRRQEGFYRSDFRWSEQKATALQPHLLVKLQESGLRANGIASYRQTPNACRPID